MLQEREQAIRERAYSIWEQEGWPEGRSLAHWSQAEAEIGAAQVLAALEKPKPASSRRTQSSNRLRASADAATENRARSERPLTTR